jgi:hypothetical protein
MGRVLLAGIVAGLVVFIWGAIAHTVLPLGFVGLKIPPETNQQATLDSLRTQLVDEGVYMLPVPQREIWEDEAAMNAFGAKAAQSPYAFVIFQPRGRDGMAAFGPLLMRQAGFDVLAAIVAAIIAAGVAGSRARRIGTVALLGVFASLVLAAPYWNWYRFPLDFTLAALTMQVIGWLLGGVVIAWLLKPRTG